MATDHANQLGKLIGNLQSLETALRFFLDKVCPTPRLPSDMTYFGLQAGEIVPVNAFTNFDTLGQLIEKYNAVIRTKDNSLLIDTTVVAVRDLLAHGRIAADSPDETRLAIIKFDRPQNAFVRVTDCATMTDQWCRERIDLVRIQLDKVAIALQALDV